MVHGPPGAVHVHEGDGLIASGSAAGLTDRPGAGGRPQGPGAQQAGQAEVVRGACSAARAAAEAETNQLVRAVAQAERAHPHQLRAQATAVRIRAPRAAASGPRTRGAYPAERSGRRLERGPWRWGCGLGRLWRWWQGSFAAQMRSAAPWKENWSLSGVGEGLGLASPLLRPVALSPTRQVAGWGRQDRRGTITSGGVAGHGVQGGFCDAAQQGKSS